MTHPACVRLSMRVTWTVAILGKTEGNGCVNDFTRAFAVSALQQELKYNAAGVSMVMPGGTEGGLSRIL